MENKLFLVPTDFSKVGDCALNHAVKVAEKTKATITLLHVVGKQEMLEDARMKLKLAKERTLKEYNFEVNTIARVGSIYEDIGDLAEELQATMVIMGTHGLRGMQFITGSRALKIVTSAPTPFIIVQEKEIEENGYDDIVVPLDLHKETKQKLSLVADMAKYFDSRVHLIVPGESDEFLRNQISRNLNYAESFFAEMDIPYTSRIGTGKKDFDDMIIGYANEIGADLISLMNLPEISLSNLIGGNYVQNIITNKHHIPVLLMNPRQVSNISIFGAYTGAG
ncbi:universal stress protein [Cryomorphaceae bacterium 1068]|nr:universal stress protein [Cryomorphaceae bacterium 1068]